MDLLRVVVKKRTEDKDPKAEASLARFSSQVAKLRGEGPMASSEEPEVTLEVVSISIADIEIPPQHARKNFGDISALVTSIKMYGIQQPLKVVKIRGTKKYRLVFGRRRLKAAQLANFDAVPCIVELTTREDRLHMLSIAENLHRHALSPLEEGDAYKFLLSQTASKAEIAKSLGISEERVERALELFELPENVRDEALNAPDRFSMGILHELIAAYRSSKAQGKKLLNAVVSGEIKTVEQARAAWMV